MNTPVEYVLVGIVALVLGVYLFVALLAPEKF
ncbi:K(+)-transporting ATPase subunit F [Thermosporothrix hazakensis]|jgi:K+-transporting ATPase KdpF subunit|nr:K(+)-transporting ATPase subunit F [Thermosporothrix hazakensis]